MNKNCPNCEKKIDNNEIICPYCEVLLVDDMPLDKKKGGKNSLRKKIIINEQITGITTIKFNNKKLENYIKNKEKMPASSQADRQIIKGILKLQSKIK